ncbi:MAG TPA: hypothetical protein VIM14_02820 [Polyangia bacterium]
MTRFLGAAMVACAVLFATLGQAAAQPVTPLEQSMEAVPGRAPALSQRYDGVVPGPTGKNPLPSPPKNGPHLVWTGFQMTATGSRVFLQTTQPVQFDIDEGAAKKSGKSTVGVLLRGCHIFMANNRRKIDTRFFATPVSGVSARQRGRDVEVRVALRELANAVPHSEPGPDGSQFVVLDFPPGKASPEPSALQDLAGEAVDDRGAQSAGADGSESSSPKTAKRAARSAR